jgi:hypothetical protein
MLPNIAPEKHKGLRIEEKFGKKNFETHSDSKL